MKKYFVIFVLFAAFLPVFLSGCASMREESEKKYMLRMFVIGAACGLATWNPGGFILGAFVADAVSVAKIRYEDIKLQNREETVRRLNQLEQAKRKGPIDKKTEQQQKEEKKAEGPNPVEKKTEQQQKEEKEAEGPNPVEKKTEQQQKEEKEAERLKNGEERRTEGARSFDKRVELFIDDATVSPQISKTGSEVETNVKYSILGPASMRTMKITETRILANARSSMEVAKREISRDQGTYNSTMKFTIGKEMPKGYCVLYTKISDGEQLKTIKSEIIINR